MERLDEASLRRFTFKLRLDPLDREQAALAFEHFFGISTPRALPEGPTVAISLRYAAKAMCSAPLVPACSSNG